MPKDLKPFELLPEFPRTPHLPLTPNLQEGDVVAPNESLEALLRRDDVIVEEKMDGANVAICYYKGHFHIRNRSHILKKGFLHKTPAGQQFRPLWNWCEQHKGYFQLLNRQEPFSEDDPATVYGEWLWMAHGIHYLDLPDFFVAFDLYDPRGRKMLSQRRQVRQTLTSARFEVPKLIHTGSITNTHFLGHLCRSQSSLYNGMVEGIYLRCPDWDQGGEKRYKMVRHDFERGKYFREDEIIRNLKRKT